MTDVRDLIQAMSLKDMEASLLTHEIQERSRTLFTEDEQFDITLALHTAAYLHRNATRANRGNLPRDTYITHPLRNATRLLRYGVEDADLIIAAILHDTVEDCADEIREKFLTKEKSASYGEGEYETQIAATRYIQEIYGWRVALIVSQVSNQPTKGRSKEDKRRIYQEHVREVIVDPDVWLVKFTDWVDNAVGLHHNLADAKNEGMVKHLAQKYAPLEQMFRDTLTPAVIAYLTEEGHAKVLEHLDKGHESLAKLKVL